MVLFPLQSGGRGVHVFQNEFQISIRLTTEQFSSLPQSILNEILAQPFVTLSQLFFFDTCYCHQIQTGLIFFQEIAKFLNLNIQYAFCGLV